MKIELSSKLEVNKIKKSKKKIVTRLEEEEKTFSQLLNETGMSKSTLSTSIKELLSEGVIKKREDSEDRRIKYYRLVDDSVFEDMEKVTIFQSLGDDVGGTIDNVIMEYMAEYVNERLEEAGLSKEEMDDDFWKVGVDSNDPLEPIEKLEHHAIMFMPETQLEDIVKMVGISFLFALLKAEQDPDIGTEGFKAFTYEFSASLAPPHLKDLVDKMENLDLETNPNFFNRVKGVWEYWEEVIGVEEED